MDSKSGIFLDPCLAPFGLSLGPSPPLFLLDGPSPAFPLSRFRESLPARSDFFSLLVVLGIPNLAARAFFFSSNVIPFMSFTLAGPAATSAPAGLVEPMAGTVAGLASVSLSAGAGAAATGFFSKSFPPVSGAAAFSSLGFSSVFLASADGEDVFSVEEGVAVAAGPSTVGASAKPNSSSSSRTCNRLASSAFKPSVDNPRLVNSALSSDTFIFLTSMVPMMNTLVCLKN
mmetsp:Transcript_15384/g.28668  ORF Transcript_15384/g.28668 Transcript_15384/m.28668 type:complete len:230 (+) Transcript_15384:280-969(+)